MKDPGNEDVLEDGTYESIKREAINCRLQVTSCRSGFYSCITRLQEPFFVMFSCKKGICRHPQKSISKLTLGIPEEVKFELANIPILPKSLNCWHPKKKNDQLHLNFGLAHVSIWSSQISHVTLCSFRRQRNFASK